VFFTNQIFLLLLVFTYIYISQSIVEMHLWCGEIYNYHIIANRPQSVLVQDF